MSPCWEETASYLITVKCKLLHIGNTDDGSKETNLTSNFSDKPKVKLAFGSQLEASNIKEGNDVYFECKVKSHPRYHKISWKRDVSKQIRIFL